MVVLERQGVPNLRVVAYRPSAYPARQAERTLACDELAVSPSGSLALAHPSSYRLPPKLLPRRRRRGDRIMAATARKEDRMRIFGLNAFVVLPVLLVTVLVVCAIIALVKYIVKK